MGLYKYFSATCNNSESGKFPKWYRRLNICCLKGHRIGTSLNILAKKQVQVLNVLLTEPGDIPSTSKTRFNRPNLSRTNVSINYWKAVRGLFLPGLFFVESLWYLTFITLFITIPVFHVTSNGLIKVKSAIRHDRNGILVWNFTQSFFLTMPSIKSSRLRLFLSSSLVFSSWFFLHNSCISCWRASSCRGRSKFAWVD